MTISQVYKNLPNEKACINLLESIIWRNVPTCPYCGSTNSVALSAGNRYHCNTCNTSYSVMVKTIFHKTKIPLQKWFYIICLKEQGDLNISLRDLGEQINTTKDTANRIVNKVNNFYLQNKELFKAINSKIINHE
jgi:transposase-like protein